MPPLAKLASATGVILLAALFALTAWKLVLHRSTRGRGLNSNSLEPQLTLQLFRGPFCLLSLAATLLVAIVYIALVIRNPGAFPEVPKPLLALLTVVNAIYLANKWRTVSAARPKNL
jgi:hypothetical protein